MEGEAEREGWREAGGCATGHNGSTSLLTSMCHLTVLQIRLHMLPGDVRTYILTVGLNLHRCTCGHFFLKDKIIPPSWPGIYAF